MNARLKIFTAIISIIAGASFGYNAFAEWAEPTAAPHDNNRARPINVSGDTQEKTGTLILSHANNLQLRAFNGGGSLTVKVNPGMSAAYGLTFPTAQGANGQVLINDGTGVLNWGSPTGVDSDWKYVPNSTSPTSIYSTVQTRIGSGGTINYATGVGDLYVQDALEVDGTIFGNLTGNVKLPSATIGAIPFVGAAGNYLIFDGSNFFWNNSTKRLGVGTNAPGTSKLYVKAASGEEALHLQAASDTSPLIMQNSSGSNIFAIDNTGTVTTGIIPYNRLKNFPTACSAGTVMQGLIDGGYTCVSPLENLGAGSNAQTLRYDGSVSKWIANSFLSNYGTYVGINASNNPNNAFSLVTGGNIGPSASDTYDLGSADYRWNNIFAKNITMTGDLNLNIAAGSVLFMKTGQKVAGDPSKLYWDNNLQYFGIGMSVPTSTKALNSVPAGQIVSTVDVNGELRLNNTIQAKRYGTAGVLKLGQVIMHARFGSQAAGAAPAETGYSLYSGDNETYAAFNDSTDKERNYSLYLGQDSGTVRQDLLTNAEPLAVGNVGFGYKAMMTIGGSTGGAVTSYNTAIGIRALQESVKATENVAIGAYAMSNNGFGLYTNYINEGNTAIGYGSLMMLGNTPNSDFSSVGYNVAIGYEAARNVTLAKDSIFIGNRSAAANSNYLTNVIAIGANTASDVFLDNNSIYIGLNSGMSTASALYRQNNIVIGPRGDTTGGEMTNNYYKLGSGSNNIFLGQNTGGQNEGQNNLFIGTLAGSSNKTISYSDMFLVNSGQPRAIGATEEDATDASRGSNEYNSLLAGRFYKETSGTVVKTPYVRVNGTTYIHSNADPAFNPEPTAAEDGSLFVEKNIFAGSVYTDNVNAANLAGNEAGTQYKGLTDVTGFCVQYGSSTAYRTKLFYVDGLLVCRSTSTTMTYTTCNTYTFAQCCAAQPGGCNP